MLSGRRATTTCALASWGQGKASAEETAASATREPSVATRTRKGII
jgi:hypothetical protein